jgi:Uma2 family endonuclease
MRRSAQIVADPVPADRRYAIELDQPGDIRMTPTASPRHREIGFSLALRMKLGGKAFQEGAIVTPQSVLTADVVWCSSEYVARRQEAFVDDAPAMPEIAEICVEASHLCGEVVSPSNALPKLMQKMDAYLTAGGVEGWIVLEDLSARIFSRDAEWVQSGFQVDRSEWRAGLPVTESV